MKFCQFVLKILSGNKFWRNSNAMTGKNWQKMTCTDPKIDVVNINAYLKFGEILSICSQDIEQKQTFGVNQGP